MTHIIISKYSIERFESCTSNNWTSNRYYRWHSNYSI